MRVHNNNCKILRFPQDDETGGVDCATCRPEWSGCAMKDLVLCAASKLLEVTQPRISDLKNGKIEKFTIDMLVKMLGKLNRKVDLKINPSKVA